MRRIASVAVRFLFPLVFFVLGLAYSGIIQRTPREITLKRVGFWKAFGNQPLLAPTDISSGPDNTLIVTDRDACKVYLINNKGWLIKAAGTVGQGPEEFRRPFGAASDGKDRIYVADTDNSRIQVYDSDLNHLKSFTPGIPRPAGIESDGKGGLWVTHGEFSGTTTYPLVHLNAEGRVDGSAGPPLSGFLSRDPKGQIWVADRNRETDPIQVLSEDGKPLRRMGGKASLAEDVVTTQGLVFYGARGNAKLRILDENGRPAGEATHENLLLTDGSSMAPYGLAVDGEGYLWTCFLDGRAVAKYRIVRH